MSFANLSEVMHKDLETILDKLTTEKDNGKLWDELLKQRFELGEEADLNEVELLQRLNGKLHLLPEKAYPYLLLSLLAVHDDNNEHRLKLRFEYLKEFHAIFGSASYLEKKSLRQIISYLVFSKLFQNSLVREESKFSRLTQDEEKILFDTCTVLAQSDSDNFLVYWCLGYMSFEGIVAAKNFLIALENFQKAANLGHVISCFLIGMIYKLGSKIIPKDGVKAVSFLQQAALQGLSVAQSYLFDEFYLVGARDFLQAAEWCKKAAAQGLPDDQFRLAEYYYKVERDIKEAVKWYQRAVRQGCFASEKSLYECYEKGNDIDSPNLNLGAILADMATQRCEPQEFWSELIRKSVAGATLNQLDLLTQLLNHLDFVPMEAYLDLLVSLFHLPNSPQSQNLLHQYFFKFKSVFERGPKAIAEKSLTQLVAYVVFMSLSQGSKIKLNLIPKQQHEIIDRLLILNDPENAVICFCLGQIFFADIGVDKDVVRAGEWMQKASEMGFAIAQYCLANFYEKGIGVVKDDDEAKKWYENAARRGNVFSSYRFFCANEVNADRRGRLIHYCRKAAVGGHAFAQHRLGSLYRENKDYAKAVIWFQKAAEQEYDRGINALSESYFFGHGVAENPVKAEAWLERGAELGFALNQYELGKQYYDGSASMPQNKNKAFFYFLKVAEQGHAGAQYYLGRCYEKGEEVNEDMIMALCWYRESAGQSNSDAQDAINRIIAEKPDLQHQSPKMKLA